MRIGLDARFLAQPGTGVHRYLTNLLHWLPRLAPEHEYFIYLCARPTVPLDDLPAQVRPRLINGPGALFSFSPRLRRALRQDALDVFHGTAYTLPWWLPCPAILTLHDLTFEVRTDWYNSIGARVFRAFIRHSASRAARVIADSNATRQDILHYYRLPPDKVVTIYLGGAEAGFAPRTRDQARHAARQLGVPTPYLFYVGGLHSRKNVPRLIEAFALARQLGSLPHRLVIVANGPPAQLAALDRLVASLGLKDHVHRLPAVSESDLPLLYAAADALIYPSLYEGFGLPTIEAMATGTAVITSRSSALTEVVGDAGLLVEPTDTQAMARTIATVLTNEALRASLAARGVAQAQKFNWEACARETVAVYETVGAAAKAGKMAA